MNTVRLPLDMSEARDMAYFTKLAKVVRDANQLELLVILAPRVPSAGTPPFTRAEFWSRCAAAFRDYPNVIFDAFPDPSPTMLPAGIDAHSADGWNTWRSVMMPLVQAIRATGAKQPIILASWNDGRMFEGAGDALLIDDRNIIYGISPHYATTRTDAARETCFGWLARRAPVAASGWDLELENPAACAAIPSDPAAVSDMIRANLQDLDDRRISWTISVLEPRKLVKELYFFHGTMLDSGWTCGSGSDTAAGLGRLLEGYLRSTEDRSLFVVGAAGGLDIPRGGFANGYGPVMAERDVRSRGRRLPLSLGGITVQVTDSAGISRPARIFWVSEGWGQVDFVIPEESAVGRARVTLLRHDASRSSTVITIADTAPGFRTLISCAGPAVGTATQVFADGHTFTRQLAQCKGLDCRAVEVPMSKGARTEARLLVSGFRHAGSARDIQVTIGGRRVPVLSYGPDADPGMDQLTIAIPPSLRGLGEADLIAHVSGRVSNVVRIRIGG